MDKLYRVTVDTGRPWEKNKTIYIVRSSKEDVEGWAKTGLKQGCAIKGIAYLGTDMTFGRTLFSRGGE